MADFNVSTAVTSDDAVLLGKLLEICEQTEFGTGKPLILTTVVV